MSYRIIELCEKEWPSHRGDCNKFVKAVARALGIHDFPDWMQANDMIDRMRDWRRLNSGRAAAHAASTGLFVVAGLAKPGASGHVAVVVPGSLAFGKYPHAYWGSWPHEEYSCANCTLDQSWRSAIDRARIAYFCILPPVPLA